MVVRQHHKGEGLTPGFPEQTQRRILVGHVSMLLLDSACNVKYCYVRTVCAHAPGAMQFRCA
eukprot:11042448-Prorocentrum_lima.AAC.1